MIGLGADAFLLRELNSTRPFFKNPLSMHLRKRNKNQRACADVARRGSPCSASSHFHWPLLLVISIGWLLTNFAAGAPINVVLFIGDGMGSEHIEAARYFANGDTQPLTMETLAHSGLMTHNNALGGITDSAASGTAMATGRKVDNQVVSVAIPGDGSELTTALEIFQTQGKRTGLVTIDTAITDATPASFAAHTVRRGNADDIADDLFHQTKPNILFGKPGSAVTPPVATAAGYDVLTDTADLSALDTETAGFVSGQFDFSAAGAPTLAQMTSAALNVLDNDPDGFFLLVEHEDIDTAGHANDIGRVVAGVMELDQAVDATLAWANANSALDDTLIIVTADHETGGLETVTNNGTGSLPTVTWSTSGHTTTPVPVSASGPTADAARVQGTIDNTDMFYILTSTPAPPPTFGDVFPGVSTGFEQAAVGSTLFHRGAGDTELEWSQTAVDGDGHAEVRDTIDGDGGGPITGHQFVVHEQSTELVSEPIDIRAYKQVQVSVDARVFQTSTEIEGEDDIDLSVLVSEDGKNYREVFYFQSEGSGFDGKGELEAAGLVGSLNGPFVTLVSPVGRIADDAKSIRVVIDADNNSSSERFIFDNVQVTGLPRTGREEVLAATSFEEPSVGDRSFAGTGRELGFTRTMDADDDGTFGDEDPEGIYGVVDSFPAADGAQVYEATGSSAAGHPVQRLVFDAVDLTRHEDVALTMDLFVSSTSWEEEDFVKIVALADNGSTVDELVILDTQALGGDIDMIGHIGEGEPLAVWETFGTRIGNQYTSAVLQIDTSSNSSVLAENFYFDNIRFRGSRIVAEPSSFVLLAGMAAIAFFARIHRCSRSGDEDAPAAPCVGRSAIHPSASAAE